MVYVYYNVGRQRDVIVDADFAVLMMVGVVGKSLAAGVAVVGCGIDTLVW
jgi:hypothetical protein